MNTRQEAQERAMVAKLSRDELEDQHFRVLEENHILKTHGRRQEEKIKRMATKLLRLASDRKKLAAMGGERRTAREVDLEEKIELQQDSLRDLNRDHEALKQKMQVMHQQMMTQSKRQTHYSGVQSRTDTGLMRKQHGSPKFRGRPHSDKMSTRNSSPEPSRYGHNMLETARNENHRLHQQVLALQEQMARMEESNQELRSDMQRNKTSHEDELLKVHDHANTTKKLTVNENIGMIKVQRQMKEKSLELTSVEARYQELRSNYEKLRSSYNNVLHEMESIKLHLAEEEKRNVSLQNSAKHGGSHQRTIAELQENIRELERDVGILKDANAKLTDSAFDREREQQWQEMERKLRLQISQLESAIKADMSDKHVVLERISSERGYASRIHSESRKAYGELDRLRHENQDLRERIRLYSAADDSVDIEELREALSVIRQRRYAASQRQRPDFLENTESNKDPVAELAELQAQHAETIQELEKTREMLLMQHKINKDYQMEVENVANQLEEMKREYEEKLERNARLLDARAARIKKLENQLHDVAYGTKQFKFQPDRGDLEVDENFNETIQLERGENLFEICVTKVTLSTDAQVALDERNPSLFVTYAFFDYELVSTPIQKSSSPLFDFTAQFTVKVDDLFLHHLQKESTIFELHQAMGIDHATIASCRIRFNQLLDKPHGKLHGSAILTGINGGNYGSLDFWVRLRVPMDQAIRLYRERTKALGYLSANTVSTQKTLQILDPQLHTDSSTDNSNQLLIQIISCNHVHGRREGVQPNIYCVYKFFDFADHDTNIIPSSNNPHFDDRQPYPVQMNSDLDAYLKLEKLIIYVFDDTDPEVSSYLGKASIDLLPLAHNKVIKAPFQLTKRDETENGTIEIAARWQLPYHSPDVVMRSEGFTEEENEVLEAQKLQKKPPVTPKKRQNVSTTLTKPSMPAIHESTDHVEAEHVMRKDDDSFPVKDHQKSLKHSKLKPVKHDEKDFLEPSKPRSAKHDEKDSSSKHSKQKHDRNESSKLGILQPSQRGKLEPVKLDKVKPVKLQRSDDLKPVHEDLSSVADADEDAMGSEISEVVEDVELVEDEEATAVLSDEPERESSVHTDVSEQLDLSKEMEELGIPDKMETSDQDDTKSLDIAELADPEEPKPQLHSVKKVSIQEPVKEKPVPLKRSSRGLKSEKTVDFEEEEEDDVENILMEDTFPEPIQVAPKKEDDDQPSGSSQPETSIQGQRSDTQGEEDGSDAASFESEIHVLEEKAVKKTPDEIKKRTDAEDRESEIEEEIAEDIEEIQDNIEEIPDDTGEEYTDVLKRVSDHQENDQDLEEGESTGTGHETLEDKDADTIRISINHLTLDPDTSIWGDTEVVKMFVEYDFLGSFEETQDAVQKPRNKNQKLYFNFAKDVKVDAQEHLEQRNLLSSMMKSGATSLQMTLVSEPVDVEAGDCKEIGAANIDMGVILRNDCDLVDDDVIVKHLENPDEVVGKLNVTVEALAVLRVIRRELDARLRESES